MINNIFSQSEKIFNKFSAELEHILKCMSYTTEYKNFHFVTNKEDAVFVNNHLSEFQAFVDKFLNQKGYEGNVTFAISTEKSSFDNVQVSISVSNFQKKTDKNLDTFDLEI